MAEKVSTDMTHQQEEYECCPTCGYVWSECECDDDEPDPDDWQERWADSSGDLDKDEYAPIAPEWQGVYNMIVGKKPEE